MTTNRNFPVFTANQVLRHDHLNDLIGFLDEQNRLTRSKTIGIGIICGFESKWGSGENNDGDSFPALEVSKGVGITSEGHIISSPDQAFTHFKVYDADSERTVLETDIAGGELYTNRIDRYTELANIYDFFINYDEAGDPMYPLVELIPANGNIEGATQLTSAYLNDKVLIAYLSCDLHSLQNCNNNNCDDTGARVELDVRFLLANRADAELMMEKQRGFEETGDLASLVADRYGIDNSHVGLAKLDQNTGTPVTFNDLSQDYSAKVVDFLRRFQNKITDSFSAYDFLLDDVYDDALRTHFIGLITGAMSNANNLGNNQLYAQYYYDLAANLSDAYDEFIFNTLKLKSICSPGANLFPKHLFLGLMSNVDKDLSEDGQYLSRENSITTGDGFFPFGDEELLHRQVFVPAPQFEDQNFLAKKVKALHFKMYEMLNRFDFDAVIEQDVKISPSKGKYSWSSERNAIPGYYDVSDVSNNASNKIYKLWSPEKTLKGKLEEVYSYHLSQSPNPIVWRQNGADFYRIEGHIGQDINAAVQAIETLRRTHSLDFTLQLVNMTNQMTQTENVEGYDVQLYRTYAKKHPGHEHQAGVPAGGTFILAYEEASGVSSPIDANKQADILGELASILPAAVSEGFGADAADFIANVSGTFSTGVIYGNELAELTEVSAPEGDAASRSVGPSEAFQNSQTWEAFQDVLTDGASSSNSGTASTGITERKVVADFALSYVCCEKRESAPVGSPMNACTFPWIHDANALKVWGRDSDTPVTLYDLSIEYYEVGGVTLLGAGQGYPLNINSVRNEGLAYITSYINGLFPNGPVFQFDPSTPDLFSIVHLTNQQFEFRVRDPRTNNVHSYVNGEYLINGQKQSDDRVSCDSVNTPLTDGAYDGAHNDNNTQTGQCGSDGFHTRAVYVTETSSEQVDTDVELEAALQALNEAEEALDSAKLALDKLKDEYAEAQRELADAVKTKDQEAITIATNRIKVLEEQIQIATQNLADAETAYATALEAYNQLNS